MAQTIIEMTNAWIADLEGHPQRDRAIATAAITVDRNFRAAVSPLKGNRVALHTLAGYQWPADPANIVVAACGGFWPVVNAMSSIVRNGELRNGELRDEILNIVERVYARLEDALGLPRN